MVKKLEKLRQKAEAVGHLEEENIHRAREAIKEANEDVKNYTSAIMNELDNLKRLIHGELTVNNNPSEHIVQSSVNKMFEQELEEKEDIICDLQKRLSNLQTRQKRKIPPVPDLDQTKINRYTATVT